MSNRAYYSTRTGLHPGGGNYDLPMLKRLFLAVFVSFVERERFQEFLGKDCIDDPDQIGTAGHDVSSFFLRALKKDDLWPIPENLGNYTEDDLFDVIEVLYDHVSVGVEGYFHSWGGCGMHYSTFDADAGRTEFREAINDLLLHYSSGFELTADGEIIHLPETGFDNLVAAELPHDDRTNVSARVEAAVRKYRARTSSLQDRKDALRSLVDVLEFLRPLLKTVLMSRDESDLFNIANNFGVRHHNAKQRTDYDENIWTSWMFYYYLATIHAAVRLLERQESSDREAEGK